MDSFSMTSSDILDVWRKEEESITINPEPSLARFSVEDVEIKGVEAQTGLGSQFFSSLILQLSFRRSESFSYIFIFSSILVVIAMAGLFLPFKLTTEKTLLLLIPQVSAMALIFWVRTYLLPNTSSLTCIETFTLFSSLLIFFMVIFFLTKLLLNSFKIIDCSGSESNVPDCLAKCLFPVIFLIFQIWFWA